MNKIKSQALSMDISLAIIIFIIAFFVFYGIISTSTGSNVAELNSDAELISKETLSQSSSLNIIDDAVLNETKIIELVDEDYEVIKKKLALKNDFCIFFEDKDGNLIVFKDKLNNDVHGIGSDKIKVNDIKCS